MDPKTGETPREPSDTQIGTATRPSRRNKVILGVLAIGAVAAGALYYLRANPAPGPFEILAATGRAALSQVETSESLGDGHLTPGQEFTYPDAFPTSGQHDPSSVNPGFYVTILAPTLLVHSAEHGHIVIYYDDPGPQALAVLREWTSQFTGDWDGVIAVPAPDLGERVVLTAWSKKLELATFEPAAAAAFIDAYRGRGPEYPVR